MNSVGTELYWLPAPPEDWRARLARAAKSSGGEAVWTELVALANYRLNFALTNALAGVLRQLFPRPPEAQTSAKPERLAILSSSTTAHLHAGLCVGALRRGLWLDVHENAYGQYRQELLNPDSGFFRFSPTSVLFSLDSEHAVQGVRECRTPEQAGARLDGFTADLSHLWRIARERCGGAVLQQAFVPSQPPIFGANEHRYPASPAAFIAAANAKLRALADAGGVDLVPVDARIARDGLAAWYNSTYWLKAKQEITITAAPMYGDMAARVLAARQGRSAKCCVLDLDNTLWGGVVGDDGPDGIVIGQGTALGEAFLAMQTYALDLRRRGIILAVCSKNDEHVARNAFAANAEMVLKESSFGCFVANWDDKAANIRAIAERLNIGLDSLVFVDDNPFERELVRRELPMVAVPELPVDPADVPACLADAGYFEGVALTDEDFARADYYGAGRPPADAAASATGMASYLAGLEMNLVWGVVDQASLARTVQLINKTNQFNLTAKRYTDAEFRLLMADPSAVCIQARLVDRFGDNGIIAIVIGRMDDGEVLELDTWLMSCRVLGRRVEEATLNIVADAARAMGARQLRGIYRPTAKNGMVAKHYEKLGFRTVIESADGTTSLLDLEMFTPRETCIVTRESPK